LGGTLRVTRNKSPITLGPNARAILNALVLADIKGGEDWEREEGVSREALERVLPSPRGDRKFPDRAVKKALGDLWKKKGPGLPIGHKTDPVKLPRDTEALKVDLWEFLSFVARGRFEEASKMVGPNTHLALPEGCTENDELWKGTVEEFKRAKARVLEAEEATAGLMQRMIDTRRLMLKRGILPWTEHPSIEEVREQLEAIEFPWRLTVPASQRPTGTPHSYMSKVLASEPGSRPNRLLVVGPHGSGKTLAAAGAFLALTDWLDDDGADAAELRPVLYVDGRDDSRESGFASDGWLEHQLGEAALSSRRRRPVVIMPHADAFLAKVDTNKALGWRLFQECDVVLGCGERFYSKFFKYGGYPSHVLRLEPWGTETQGAYAAALLGEPGRVRFESWRDAKESRLEARLDVDESRFEARRDADESRIRRQLCEVPLHLTLVLSWINSDSELISTSWRLLEQLARERLGAAGLGESIDAWMNELAAVADRFYVAQVPPQKTAGFSVDALRKFLRERSGEQVPARLETIVGDTLITVPATRGGEFHFEQPVWAEFFTAWHLAGHVMLNEPGETVLPVFGRYLTPSVLAFCEEMLRERTGQDGHRILASLGLALFEEDRDGLRNSQFLFARGHVAYLLAALGDEETREELAARLDEGAERVSDPVVRGAIERGLKSESSAVPAGVLLHRDGA
jgi:hypothetical protein